jgi:hypothetical protein
MVIFVAARRTFRPYVFFVPLLSHNFLGLRAHRPVDRPGEKQPFLWRAKTGPTHHPFSIHSTEIVELSTTLNLDYNCSFDPCIESTSRYEGHRAVFN